MTDTDVVPAQLAVHVDGPPLASWPQRVVAALLDGAILSGATWLLLGSGVAAPSLTPHAPLSSPPPDGLVHSPVSWFASPWLVALVLGMLALQGWTGATPGKRVVGVAVVRASDGLPAGLLVSAVRVVAHVLDAILLIGYLRPLVHQRRQTFADSIVGTLAVSTRQPAAHPWFARFRREPSAPASALVTVAAVVVCGFGIGFSTPVSSWGQQTESAVPCAVDGTVGTSSAVATVVRASVDRGERRLWVSRETDVDVDLGLSVRWTWTATDRQLRAVSYETDLQGADGSVVTTYQDTALTGRASNVLRDDPAVVRADDLRTAGADWTAQTRLVVDGRTAGACTIEAADVGAAANRG